MTKLKFTLKSSIFAILALAVLSLASRPENCAVYDKEQDICSKCNDYYFLKTEKGDPKPTCNLCDLFCRSPDFCKAETGCENCKNSYFVKSANVC